MLVDHHLTVSLPQVLAQLDRGQGGPEDAPSRAVPRLLLELLRHETRARVDELKALYEPLDPQGGTRTVTPAQAEAFTQALSGLLRRANYRRLDDAELAAAMRMESLFHIRLHTDLRDFQHLAIHVRGQRHREVEVRTWFGMRRRRIAVDSHRRVLVELRYADSADLLARGRKLSAAQAAIAPGATRLKLFAEVPAADLEMVLPNAEVRMRYRDLAAIGVPALLGIGGVLVQAGLVFGILLTAAVYLLWKVGLRDGSEPPFSGTQLIAVAMPAFAIWLFINRQLGRYRFRKLQFFKALAEQLYLRNLDNDAGAIHHIADEAGDEEAKEALLAWQALGRGPADAATLDGTIEEELRQLGCPADFEIDDALAKLERLGLASRNDAGLWTAVDSATARERLAAELRRRIPGL